MIRRISLLLFILSIILSASSVLAQSGALNPRGQLLRSVSQKGLVETAREHMWALDFPKSGRDTVHIIAIRIEFQPDSFTITTGDGLFGFNESRPGRGRWNENDRKERDNYANGVYKFDALPHDSMYFVSQLTALRNYYDRVSRGNLTLDFSIYPSGSGELGYQVPGTMRDYSPGLKDRRESRDEYWERKTRDLMKFVKEALETAGRSGESSPFWNLRYNDDGVLVDALGRKAVILIFHAGSSYLTDGGMGGEPDSPSDMIDAFITPDFFRYWLDSTDAGGITVTGSGGDITINEVMMSAATSNQDGLNWGIQGILVNQMARQLGIPDLFSTSSGVSAVGAFCIMDFAGYSAGQGFIPPYPSAWVRAFMGWDRPVAAGIGGASYDVKALTSVLDRNGGSSQPNGRDTTILLIPLNNSEYYLVENRQRNLSGADSLFLYDTTDNGRRVTIGAYPFNVNVAANVRERSGASSVILKASNSDISLPASGMLVWHVDERVIRNRLEYNLVNADSSYRGVRLVEADGINDLGVTFSDAFYQAAFDYGGAEDVFPHRTGDRETVREFGPYSRPSTRSNDGGHTYLKVRFGDTGGRREEKTLNFRNEVVTNYSDSVFRVSIEYDHIAPGWPRRAAPDRFYDPLAATIALSPSNGGTDAVLAVLSETGKLYLFSADGDRAGSYGSRTAEINLKDYYGGTVTSSERVTYFDSIPGTYTFPTAVNGSILIPSTHGDEHRLHIYNSLDVNSKTVLTLPAAPSSYVCGISAEQWAVGLTDGKIVVGSGNSISETIQLDSISPVNAIAALSSGNAGGGFAVIQSGGALSIITEARERSSTTIRTGIPPYGIVTGDLDNDGSSELVISDSRQGVWVYTQELRLAHGWNEEPNDWATKSYYIDPERRPDRDRERYPRNFSTPAIADINRDGSLDIIISGINGVYALNRRGALLSGWPAYLDNRYWYERGSVTAPPIVVSSAANRPLVLFSSPTGERATYSVTKIVEAFPERGVITFLREDGSLDSLWGVSASVIDTVLTIGDSLISPFVLPGGFVDALNANAARPLEPPNSSWRVPQSRWPMSAGAPMATSPVARRAVSGAAPDIFAVASDGAVYKWKLNGMISDSLYWPQTGFNAARSFAYGGPAPAADPSAAQNEPPITFWNYPNPTSRDDARTTFKYKFNGPATNVRLDIQSITGRRMDTFTSRNGQLSGDFPDWNELSVDLRRYGPGIYRCRMEASIGGRRHVMMWKMAVVR